MCRALFVLATLLIAVDPASAEVKSAGETGFCLELQARVPQDPAKAFSLLVDVEKWWHPDHTYSLDASNLKMDFQSGWFIEKLPSQSASEGWVRHMQIAYYRPGKKLGLVGGLGPLQEMGINGALSFKFETSEQDRSATEVVLIYNVGGYAPDGLESLAAIVDGVLAEQLKRFESHCREVAKK